MKIVFLSLSLSVVLLVACVPKPAPIYRSAPPVYDDYKKPRVPPKARPTTPETPRPDVRTERQKDIDAEFDKLERLLENPPSRDSVTQ